MSNRSTIANGKHELGTYEISRPHQTAALGEDLRGCASLRGE